MDILPDILHRWIYYTLLVDTLYVSVTHGQSDARSMVIFPAYAGTHCTYPRRDGQAELTWMAGNMPRRSSISALTGLAVE